MLTMQSLFEDWKPRWLNMKHREWHAHVLTLLCLDPNFLWMMHPHRHQRFDFWELDHALVSWSYQVPAQPLQFLAMWKSWVGQKPCCLMDCTRDVKSWTFLQIIQLSNKLELVETSVHQKLESPDECTKSCLKLLWSSWWPYFVHPSAIHWSYNWWDEVVRGWRCCHWFC